jgi:hypothetical protein
MKFFAEFALSEVMKLFAIAQKSDSQRRALNDTSCQMATPVCRNTSLHSAFLGRQALQRAGTTFALNTI